MWRDVMCTSQSNSHIVYTSWCMFTPPPGAMLPWGQ